MDKPIKKSRWPHRFTIVCAITVFSLAIVSIVLARARDTRIRVGGERLNVARVTVTTFQEYVPISGTVQPSTSVYLDLEEGGIVEKVYVEGGSPIKAGDLILSFSNTTAQKQNIEAETRLIDNLNQLRNSKITLTQSQLSLKDQLLDLEFKIKELERTFGRYQRLLKSPSAQISKEQFESTRDQIAYLKNKHKLLQERTLSEAQLQEQQSAQIESSIQRVNRNLEILSRIVDSLEVRAPVDGYLSTLQAEVGQSFQRGQRVGQIDQLDTFKVRGDVDEYYVSKVAVGQLGGFEFANRRYQVRVSKVYPEVTEQIFHVDLEFVGEPPAGIKRGQSVRVDLSLSEARKALVLPKGSFYAQTNGRWVYRLDAGGSSARRIAVVAGRQNPQFIEILQGLQVGDQVITSDYSNFNNAEELAFPEPVRLMRSQ